MPEGRVCCVCCEQLYIWPPLPPQVRDKLSVFWQLRRDQVRGARGGLPVTDGHSVEGLLNHSHLDSKPKCSPVVASQSYPCFPTSLYPPPHLHQVRGILNALPLNPASLAGQLEAGKLALDDVASHKETAKLEFQKRFGLAQGAQWELVVFLGRMTHQKGCDIIAKAAAHYLRNAPKVW